MLTIILLTLATIALWTITIMAILNAIYGIVFNILRSPTYLVINSLIIALLTGASVVTTTLLILNIISRIA